MNSYYHAASSASKWGGEAEDYIEIHNFIDQSKMSEPSVRHRAILHHSLGVFITQQCFGSYIVNSNGRKVPVKEIAERHIIEDLGFLPSAQDWLKTISLKAVPWAGGGVNAIVRSGQPISHNILDRVNKTKEQKQNEKISDTKNNNKPVTD